MSDTGGRGFSRTPDLPDRMVISPQGTYILNGVEAITMGGNYVMKAPPYFPPLSVVKADAKAMAEGVRNMTYRPPPASDGSLRKVVPAVRLGALWEAAMPDRSGKIDATYAARLDETVAAFKAKGVYVFLDSHQDAVCTTNGGEGMPWWIAADMQRTSPGGCCGFRHCCCCCKGCGSAWYVTTPEQPLSSCVPLPECLLKCFGLHYDTYQSDPDPWRAYSVGAEDGNPARMNIGNPSMRLNNYDIVWGKLGNSVQANNLWNRFIESPFHPNDRKLVFDHFMTHIKHLCSVWRKHHNVIAVDPWNEPLVSGYLATELYNIPCTIRRTYSFYGAVLEELEADGVSTPVCVAELPTGGLKNMTCASCIFGLVPISSSVGSLLRRWAHRGQLILEWHYYPGAFMVKGIEKAVSKAKQRAARLGEGTATALGEFWPGSGTQASAEAGGELLAKFTEAGSDSSLFWLYTNTKFTDGNPGWYKYTPAVQAAGGPIVNETRTINTAVWPEYEKTVRGGTSFGAHITGEGTGIMGVLELVQLPKGAKA